ncbi:MAG: 30S ribosomal protein S27ae [Thermoplasmata archaeon]
MSKESLTKIYEVSGDKLNRKKKTCPKCGPGYFLAEHENRVSCGRCGYTEFKK